ncbi:ABC transporter permease [Paramicrobacterium agarici]|uniref:ABC transporter permease n=1 Tax=Paramicrobacterium agarici TaxID=630514 RepID=UPI00114FFD11|nr:ABC transporter permease [Microbacterium agarici]TQO21585.1 oligopeptide transport system permease protein [Microbacterium agarici]
MSKQIPHYVAPVDKTPVVEVDSVKLGEKPGSMWRDAWRSIRRRPLFYISAVIALVFIAMALFPTWFTQVSPTQGCTLANSNAGPQGDHILGFTRQGCDIWARIVWGAQTSLAVGIISTLLGSFLGVLFGIFAGFYGGWTDSVLSRIGDIFFSIPYILAAVVVMSVFSDYRNVWTISLAIGGFAWASVARILRSEVLRVKNQDYVMAAIALGRSRFTTMMSHVLPNSLMPVIVVTTLNLGLAMVGEATLSFLGVGMDSSVMSWGNDISDAQTTLRTAPMALIYPSIALTVAVLAFIMLGEVLRDALDPKARTR